MLGEGARKVVVIGTVLLMAGSVVAVALVGGRSEQAPAPADSPTRAAPTCEEPGPEPSPPPSAEGYCHPPPRVIDASEDYVATISTSRGDIVVDLHEDRSPVTVNNLVYLAREGFFRGVPFHRVVPDFVIQGGDPTGTGAGGPGYVFGDELALARELASEHGGYPRGVVAMANRGPDTNGSQFFIVQGDVVPLDPAFTVFGTVIEGMEVVDAIAAGPTGDHITEDPVRIGGITVGTRADSEPGS